MRCNAIVTLGAIQVFVTLGAMQVILVTLGAMQVNVIVTNYKSVTSPQM